MRGQIRLSTVSWFTCSAHMQASAPSTRASSSGVSPWPAGSGSAR